jgi:hypothetical protein
MRSVSVLCDNHHDRLAVATYRVAKSGLGRRPLFPTLEVQPVRAVDLCAECAAILGWETKTPLPTAYADDEPVTEKQRRLLFARFGELGFDDDDRHTLLLSVTGDPSIRNLLAKDVDRVLTALDLEAGRR